LRSCANLPDFIRLQWSFSLRLIHELPLEDALDLGLMAALRV
jgi:hypothetical protein